MYNYREAVKEDVKNWMDENHEPGASREQEFDYDTVFEGCWVADEVTGNGSGSYTFSRLEARRNFFEDDDSEDYVSQMIQEGFSTAEEVGKHMASGDWEWLDVCIRCYLLGEVVQEVIDEMDF